MNNINIGIFELDIQLQKLVKYGLDKILINNVSEYNIKIDLICDNNFMKMSDFDYLIMRISFEQYITYKKNINNLLSQYKGFKRFIFIVEHKKCIINNYDDINTIIYDTKLYDVNFCHIYIEKAIDYLSVIYDDIQNINQNIINNILKDELGKQKFKQLNDYEKKLVEIKNLSKNVKVVNEWIKMIGFDIFIDIIQTNFIVNYNKIIQSHCIESINKIELLIYNQDINFINDNNSELIIKQNIII